MAATARVHIVMHEADKISLTQKARKLDMSLAELLRLGGEAYDPQRDDSALDAVLARVKDATSRAEMAIDACIADNDAALTRIAAKKAAHKKRMAAQ